LNIFNIRIIDYIRDIIIAWTMSTVFCGLDIHKETTYATILGPDKNILVQKRMSARALKLLSIIRVS